MRCFFYAGLLAPDERLSEAFGKRVSFSVLDKVVYSKIVYDAVIMLGDKFDREKLKPWLEIGKMGKIGTIARSICEAWASVKNSYGKMEEMGIIKDGTILCPPSIVCGTIFPIEVDNDVPIGCKLLHGYLNFLNRIYPHLTIRRETLSKHLSMSIYNVDYAIKKMYAAGLGKRTYKNGMPEIAVTPFRPEKKQRKGTPEDINDYRPY